MALDVVMISAEEVEKLNVVEKFCFGNKNVKTTRRQVLGLETFLESAHLTYSKTGDDLRPL